MVADWVLIWPYNLASISSEYSYSRYGKAVFDFQIHFWYLHQNFQLPMTLKCHVIIDYYLRYFYETNGEYVEAFHQIWKSHEYEKKYKVKENLGTDGHLKKFLKNHVSFNSFRVGSPKTIMTLRKVTPSQSPLSARRTAPLSNYK